MYKTAQKNYLFCIGQIIDSFGNLGPVEKIENLAGLVLDIKNMLVMLFLNNSNEFI